MLFICDAPRQRTWFQIETEKEAMDEAALMSHAVDKYYLLARQEAEAGYVPTSRAFIEQDIGRAQHIQRKLPIFATLRDSEGGGLATAMLPPKGVDDRAFTPIIVGVRNQDPYGEHADAIEALGRHFGLTLDRARCYPYQRR